MIMPLEDAPPLYFLIFAITDNKHGGCANL